MVARDTDRGSGVGVGGICSDCRETGGGDGKVDGACDGGQTSWQLSRVNY